MTVALVTERHELVEWVRSVTGPDHPLHLQPWRNGQPFHAERIVREMDAGTASVVCIGDDVPLDLAIEVAAVADRDHRVAMSVVLVARPSSDLWRDAVRAGVRDIVDPHLVDVELAPALGRAAGQGRLTTLHIPEQSRVLPSGLVPGAPERHRQLGRPVTFDELYHQLVGRGVEVRGKPSLRESLSRAPNLFFIRKRGYWLKTIPFTSTRASKEES